ncbi:sn-glycerol-3-phosphate ABC transporter ATP-binding protein UgpC [Legionella anisa]|uniref:Sn-glycerol-3-phosphate ABC transporter ATP-binding protein UgpC n=1 Tax=Legionella anisa TaxID=28082 RepID=A0AAX0WTY8_9GAMM|nr:sn-glycerol-3-phosphate ABC transporter ATP-binding protein UgpC [Legionella anisa]AWN74143.1 sn-glycerol-3-phosphate ABC transporter ATP-binding protein UgpC [Legionella anisa]KTC71425.1 sn-glycerol-3-phosphate import ATP-binding protein UgpC [Legionella anisa]MBN5935168.1 sn-glycerol-3-phosphate ABC transporter ATP-binding protein UgpC [Legionella anisa]MCW8425830.1 sn-glycerol-3-phosphate ABC transporter ATP-binding protein UgpC [Legionella anisa]MCW8448739.1 sn-glycerol-3-phosphate ABC 
MATVSLIDVSKSVGATTILDKVNVSIKKGEFMVIVGPSGCGKTTLLRLIAGLDDLSSGSILINEQCVNKIPAAKRDMAMVFQNYALYPHMSVFENMAYGLKMRRFKKADIKQRVDEAAQLLHLTPYLERKPQALSGGQKQRVAMGRAMVRSPAVFLFDEPLSNLDAKLRTEMRHEIRRLHQQLNTTSLYVTHDQTEAMTMADRVMVLNQGVVEQIGTPQELYQNPATLFVAGFTGHYPLNIVSGVFDKNSNTVQTDMGVDYLIPELAQNFEDKDELIMAIRAEHVGLSSENNPQSISIHVEFVDNMGADKLIHATCIKNNQPLNLRVTADQHISSGQLWVELPKIKLHLFHRKSGKRIGEWRE